MSQYKILLYITTILILGFTYGEAKGTSDSLVYPLNYHSNGKTYSDMAIDYWVKMLEQYDNKTADVKDDCFLVSSEDNMTLYTLNPFWAPQTHYECTIKSDQRLFVNMFAEECDKESTAGGIEDLKICAIENNQYARGTLVINDEIIDSSDHTFFTPLFNITFTPNNPYNAEPGIYEAIINGAFAWLKPLEPGNHHLEYTMVQIKPTHDNDYAAKTTYDLHVID